MANRAEAIAALAELLLDYSDEQERLWGEPMRNFDADELAARILGLRPIRDHFCRSDAPEPREATPKTP